MRVHVDRTPLDDVPVISPRGIFEDDRTFFPENHSRWKKGVACGLHVQWNKPMAKLMRVTYGVCFLVAVGIREDSRALGRWFGMEASAENEKQLWATSGFARGFYVLSEFAELQYKSTALHNPPGEGSIRWDDSAIGIEWPGKDPLLPQKDCMAKSLADWLNSRQSETFRYLSAG
jgi:dTDP-4-dehydrorhamnose 3,5-epimerase